MSEDRSSVEDVELEEQETETAEDDDEGLDDGAAEEGAGETEPADDAAGPEEDQSAAAAAPARRPDRIGKRSASERFQDLANTNRQLRERLDALERTRVGADAQARQAAEAERVRAWEEQNLPVMAPHEIGRYFHDKSQREFEARLNQTQFRLWDQNDQQNFARELAANPKLARFEARVDELRAMAPGVSRLDLLDKAIGEATRKNIGAATRRQQSRAETDLRGRSARPAAGRGDTRVERQRSGRGDFEHMRNVLI